MTIYWNPVEDQTDPDSIDVWHVQDDTQTDIGPADVSGVPGMPDSIGGVAPDAVRDLVSDKYYDEITSGTVGLNDKAAQIGRDRQKMDYIRGTPP